MKIFKSELTSMQELDDGILGVTIRILYVGQGLVTIGGVVHLGVGNRVKREVN